MSIYLAWSLYKLISILGFAALVVFGLWFFSDKSQSPNSLNLRHRPKLLAAIAAVWLAVILISAFNVGDRQQHLTRSHSNATFDEVAPAYVPPPPDHLKAAREALDKSVLELNNSIKERKQ